MIVVLILVAVALAPIWARRYPGPRAYVLTAGGWLAAMAIVVGSGTVDDLDLGFWLFNSFLLIVALGLAGVLGRSRSQIVSSR